MAGRSVVYCLPNENRRFSQREAEALELNLTQKQVQTLSPQMMQSMEILQMGSQELLEYIEEAVQENPVLEPEEPMTSRTSSPSSAASWSGWSPPTRRTATTTSRTPRRRTAPLTTSAPYRTTTRTSTIMSSPSSGYWSWSQR